MKINSLILGLVVHFAAAFFCPFAACANAKTWTLHRCIEYALEHNVAYKQQQLSAEVQAINLHQSKMNRLPTLFFSDVHTLDFGNTISSSGSQVANQNTSGNLPSLSASVILFNGMKYRDLVTENELNYQSGLLDVETQKNNLQLSIVAAYEQVLYEDEVVAIAQRQIESDSIEVKRVELYVAVGQTPEDSLLLLQAQLATDRSAKVSAETLVILAAVQLQQLMELPISPDFSVEKPSDIIQVAGLVSDPADVYMIASATFPDEKSAALKTNALEVDLHVSKSALFPTLSLSGGLSSDYSSALARYHAAFQNEVIGYLQNNSTQPVWGSVLNTTTQSYPFLNQMKDNFSEVLALNLSVPIFNGYRARNNIRLSQIAVRNARLNEQAVTNNLRKNIETACANQLAGSRNYLATLEQLKAETRAYENMKRKFDVGLATVTEYLVEQSNLYKANLANLQARYTYIFQSRVVGFYTGAPLTD